MRRVLWVLLLLPIMLLGCALVMLWVPLPEPLPPQGAHARNLPAAILTGTLGLFWVLGLVVYVVSGVLRYGRSLDGVFLPMGMASRPYMLFGRQYEGVMAGRKVKATFLPGRMPAVPLFDLYVETDGNIEVALGRTRPLLACRHCPEVEIPDDALQELKVYCCDAGWVRSLLGDKDCRAVVEMLLLDEATASFRELNFQEGRIWLRVHLRRVDSEDVASWLEGMMVLAERHGE